MVISRWRGWYGLVLGGGIGLGGCSLLFSGSDYQGVGSPRDAGSDAADDARTPDARADAAATCEGAACTVKPSFVNDPNMALTGTADVVIAEDEQATWDLETGVLDHGGGAAGENIALNVESQGSGQPKLAVFRVKSFVMEEGSTLRLVGATHAVSILAVEDIVIDGTIDLSAVGESGGPGGASSDVDGDLLGTWNSTGRPGLAMHQGKGYVFAGGGGGSNGAPGGAGGLARAAPFGGTFIEQAGGPAGDVAELSGSFSGGGAGGPASCGDQTIGVRGGGGGGALQLVSQSKIDIGANGVLLSAGAGGRTSDEANAAAVPRCVTTWSGAGGGGGAGGSVVLEAPTVQVNGAIYVNGGGGAAGDTFVAASLPGEDGKSGTSVAMGRPINGTNTATIAVGGGGNGGAKMPTNGVAGERAAGATELLTSGLEIATYGGGGGGGAGRIVVRSRTGSFDDSEGTFSPAGDLLVVEKVKTFTPE